MKTNWRTKPLGEVCEINPKNELEDTTPDTLVSFVPMAAVGEQAEGIAGAETRAFREVAKGYTPFRERDVLFAKITPCMENGKAAVASQLTNGLGFGSTEFHVLRAGGEVTPEWVFAFVRRGVFRAQAAANFTGTAGQQRVPTSFLARSLIPLPPLDEQQRIVGLLDAADELRRLRAEADRRTAALIPAIFHEMFGEDNRGDWLVTQMGKLAADKAGSIRTGPFGSQLLHSEFVEQGVPVLGIDNVVLNEFRWTHQRCVPIEKYEQFRRFRVYPNDLLITIMGTTGRVSIAPPDLPECMSTKHLCVITLDSERIAPRYLWGALLYDRRITQQLRAKGAGAIMEGWNSTIIKSIEVRVPPLPLQRQFVEWVAEVRALEAQQAASRERLEALFQAMLHRAFAEEL